MELSGKTVIITGASAGIGAATARAFAQAQANVVLAARNAERLETVRRSLPGRHLAVSTDITDTAQVEALVAQAVAAFGRIDIVVSNAGVGLAAPVTELRDDDLLQALRVNVLGPLALTRAVLPHMQRQGHGKLMFVSSVVGLRALPYLGGYAAVKAALDRLTEALRVELRGSNITVTLVRPGTTRTEFRAHRLGGGHEQRRANTRAATPEQVASAIVRGARRKQRVVYVSARDKLVAWAGVLLPRITDRVLARTFTWDGDHKSGNE